MGLEINGYLKLKITMLRRASRCAVETNKKGGRNAALPGVPAA
ncbi:hypothetical protein [Nitratireductor aquibiodomus]|nr:hypothetical protein [Nitratireductor aquibiodomus]